MLKVVAVFLFVALIFSLAASNFSEQNVLGRNTKRKPRPTPTPTPISVRPIKWGAFAGGTAVQAGELETKVGKPVNYVATFVHWGNESRFPTELGNFAKQGGKTLVIFWEAMDYNFASPEDPRFSYDKVLAGTFDNYFSEFKKQLTDFGGEVILIPFEEMNGNWYPWSGTINGNTPAKHIAAYRYLRDKFRDAANVKFGWAVNDDSVPDQPGNQSLDYYPGDNYVDYTGINGFNFDNPWLSFSQIFDRGLTKLETLNKDIIIFSTSCAAGQNKAAWISDAFGVEVFKHPKIIGWIWFNENKEKDWRIWSDQNSLSAFQSVLNRYY